MAVRGRRSAASLPCDARLRRANFHDASGVGQTTDPAGTKFAANPGMAHAQLNQFIYVLIWKAGPLIILCICGAIVLPELVRRIARRVTGSIHARAGRRTLDTPPCPSCDRPMVKRTVRRGFRAGSEVWGCSNYPACSDTRSV